MAEQSAHEESEDSMTDRNRELRGVFVTVTGCTGFTEVQKEQSPLRSVAPEESLSGSVTEIAKNDGLSDMFSDFEDTTDSG